MSKAKATLMTDSDNGGSGHSIPITVAGLRRLKTPKATDTWNPVPYVEIVDSISTQVKDVGWKFAKRKTEDRFDMVITPNKDRVFGVTSITTPDDDEDFGLAIGFRCSHNKTLALGITVGTRVFVCDNLCFYGDVVVRREQTRHADAGETVALAFEQIPQVFEDAYSTQAALRKVRVDENRAVRILCDAVDAGALPLNRLFGAIEHWRMAVADEVQDIKHVNTLWGVQQAVTHEWKGLTQMALPVRSNALTGMLAEITA
jgi:hypothetical protein